MPFPAAPTVPYRAAVLAAADAELQTWRELFGQHDDYLCGLWASVLPTGAAPINPHGLAWCGCFALHCLKAAGLAEGVYWRFGTGFLAQHCTRTTAPAPGDVAYFDQPYQHHALVEDVQGDVIFLIAGNTPGISRSYCPRNRATYYSIEPLIDKAQEAQNG